MKLKYSVIKSHINLKTLVILILGSLFTNTSYFAQDRHYWDQAVGGKAALLGGLVVGSVRDYSAVFYNPGATGFLDKNKLDFSFSAYGLKDFRFKNGSGIDPDPSYTSLTLYPSSLAGGIPFLSDSVNRFGYMIYGNAYSVVRSSARYEDYGDFIADRPDKNSLNDEIFVGEELVINQGKFNALLQEVTVGFNWGRKISDDISIGATLFGAYRDQTKLRNEYYYALDTSNQKMTNSNVFVDIDYFSIRLFGKVGIAAEFKDLKFGAALTLPSMHIYSGATVGASFSSTNYLTEYDSLSGSLIELDILGSDRQEDLNSRFRSPFSLSIGLEYEFIKGSKINLSSEWFSKIEPYVVIQPKSDIFFRNLTREAGFFDSEQYLRVYDSFQGVINFGVGIVHKVSDMFTGYASFRTDFSNAAFEKINGYYLGFTDFDVYHFTIGTSTIFDNSFISAGLEYSFGVNSKFEQIFSFPSGTADFQDFFLQRNRLNSKAVYNSITLFLGITHLLGD